MTKKFIALAFGAMLAGMAFTSCSKDGSEDIIGTWEVYATQSNNGHYVLVEDLVPLVERWFIFNQDNTGMMIYHWAGMDGSGYDITKFTYSTDGEGGTISMEASSEKASWTSTYVIQNIKEETMVVYKKTISEDYQRYIGDTTPHTEVFEQWYHCKKK